MASEAYFKNTFCTEVEREWKGKLSPTKAQMVWNSVRNFQDESLKAAIGKILRETNFPGVDKIIEYCTNEENLFRKNNFHKAVSEGCGLCNSGARIVNNYAYRCTCKLGMAMYPNWPVYGGQAPWADKHYTDKEGNEVLETLTHIFRKKPGSKNLRDFSFTIKNHESSWPKENFQGPKLVKMNQLELERF